jgi:hypothetical protein
MSLKWNDECLLRRSQLTLPLVPLRFPSVCSFPPRVGTASAKILRALADCAPEFCVVRERTSMPLRGFGFQSTFFKTGKMKV